MCGRYVLASSREELLDIFQIGVDEAQPVLPSFNIAPSQEVAIVVQPEARRLEPARWGFVPSYAKSLTSGPTPFNARDDKVLTSGMYKAAFAKHRAIFPADGFYERRKTGERQSFYIHPLDSKILAIAGFYGWWRQPGIEGAPWLLTATMVTRPAQGKMVG
ncbi:MAG: SOS response-associated peptidase, partial [Propionibacteriaceae bacterium]|nr:SOS response-associated peptidase [Propionibacteriaceae bacterium]